MGNFAGINNGPLSGYAAPNSLGLDTKNNKLYVAGDSNAWTPADDSSVSGYGTLASATAIAPVNAVTGVSGTTTIETITVPKGFPAGGQLTLIPTGLWVTGLTGNIALATTAVVDKALIMTWNGTAWFPSY